MAQEFLKPLNSNLNYLYSELLPPSINNYLQPNKKNQIVSLSIPFLDDFYYANSNNYPNQLLWQDSSTYVNIGYPIAPPSFGVATFDGLNKFGYPYLPSLNNLNLTFPADTLESQPINLYQTANQILLPSDSIALSFYYQARGNGDPPELKDSLILDFYQPNKNMLLSQDHIYGFFSITCWDYFIKSILYRLYVLKKETKCFKLEIWKSILSYYFSAWAR